LMKSMAGEYWSEPAMKLKQDIQFIESISEEFPVSAQP